MILCRSIFFLFLVYNLYPTQTCNILFFQVLDLSHSPIASLSDKELIKKDEYFEEKKCIEKYVKFLWKNFMENGEIDFNSIPEWEEFNIEEGFEDNFSDNFKIPK